MRATSSAYIEVRQSNIHNNGVFARKNIPKNTRIIEYVGEKISKKEADRRASRVLSSYKEDGNKTLGGVYIFEVDEKHDIDGNKKYNTARLINHSCMPNCETINDNGRIWIYSKRNIKKGEELSYDYGYSLDNWHEHPCRCGTRKCVGYIVNENKRLQLRIIKFWKNLKIMLKLETKK